MSSRSGVERIVWFHSMALQSIARTQDHGDTILPIKKLTELEDAIKNSVGFEHPYTINKHRSILNLQDFSISDCGKFLVLLINLSETAGSIKVIKDNENKTRREFSLEKGKDQGFEYSSHILISKTKNNDKRHVVLIEKSPLLSSHYIQLFINKILFNIVKKNEGNFIVKHPFGVIDPETGTVKMIRFKPSVDLENMPDDNLMEAIRTGKFSSIRLISREEKIFNGADSNVEIVETQREIKLSTNFTSTTGSFFKGVKERYSDEFSTVKVGYTSEGVNSSAAFSISNITADGLEKAVTKKVLIDEFQDTLKDSYESISSEILEKMLELTR